MRIVVDLDGTLCTLKQHGQTYADVLPMPEAVHSVRHLKEQGHQIIIYTARNMKTQEGNVGRVVANIGRVTMDWLARYEVPYDEIVFGKPYGDVYIDDLALTFESWPIVLKTLQNGRDQ